ncbi:unnamed protein product [Owenia fusiformis]|uniref:Uncharacterized protein n=1 Tax=Owenia fusiformis TaxID=6347 RepID=A0A8J1TVE7_OWEFU|nr:unnamed protein product [Owenia fusiformis]
MTNTIKRTLFDIISGMRDAILGTLKIHKLDEEVSKRSAGSVKAQEQLSVLAQRRAERDQHKTREKKVESEPKVLHRIFLCCAWNGGIFWLSIIAFNGLLLPCIRFLLYFVYSGSSKQNFVWSWMGPLLSWIFSALWILPLFVISKIVNSLWFQDIADAAYKKARGRPQMLPSFSKVIADILFSLLLQSLFLIQGMLASLLPIPAIGYIVALLHMCLLYSLYAFEYKWFNMGWPVQQRLSYIESNWPYFFGFGLPLALLTSWPSSYIVSGCVFSILFPLFIISANEAEPIRETFEFPLQLFSPVISLTNSIFRHSVTKTRQRHTSGHKHQKRSSSKS